MITKQSKTAYLTDDHNTDTKKSPLYQGILFASERDSNGNSVLPLLMLFPSAFCNLHIAEYRTERRILRAAGIYTKSDLTITVPQMTNTHLTKLHSVLTALHTVIALSPAESVPHLIHIGRNIGSGPIGVSVIGYYATKPLETLVFIFDGRFQPVFTIQINCDATLIKTTFTVKLCLNCERKIPFFCPNLKYWSIVVLKTVIRTLPQVSVWLRIPLSVQLKT